jgi:UDP-N-acetyl-D-glucosamine dehydrogenase
LYKSVPIASKTLEKMDAVILVTDHSVFDYDFIISHCKIVLDTRNAVRESRENVYKL